MDGRHLTFISNKKKTVISVRSVLYCITENPATEVHTVGGTVYKTRMKFAEIESQLGESFIKIHRGCVVSPMAIHEITDKIYLNNGEALIYTQRKKNEIIKRLHEVQKNLIDSFHGSGIPATEEEYNEHYKSFDTLPFAFTDIELVFNDEIKAVDWIFRYGNAALANLERVPLEKLIGKSFGSVFPNMDSKWLRAYERATLYGEMLEIIDYSPEINANLKVICFPTFKGHCGCILFNTDEIKFIKNSSDAEKAMMLYFGKILNNE